ncbi:MAG: phosphatidylserine decarboxylase [Proteobacteria bacterium]|nr:phosphatidylserine decarboxylase [Pseudomonadota bacterium]
MTSGPRSAWRNAWQAVGDSLNFALTNRIPRRALTTLAGRLARIEQPLVRAASIGLWRCFADLDLADARKSSFTSLHDCFVRELVPGARPVDADPDVLASPCDALVGACGTLDGDTLLQAKGSRYALAELLGDTPLAAALDGGAYATLRLKSSMYHRFHAPCDGRVTRVDYFAGDAWNVNPPALARVPRLYCRNERAVVRYAWAQDAPPLVLVPVAAILVASIRFRFLDVPGRVRAGGVHRFDCAGAFARGDEMGWFEHGSTIIVLVPQGFVLHEDVQCGAVMRMGRALFRRARQAPARRSGDLQC